MPVIRHVELLSRFLSMHHQEGAIPLVVRDSVLWWFDFVIQQLPYTLVVQVPGQAPLNQYVEHLLTPPYRLYQVMLPLSHVVLLVLDGRLSSWHLVCSLQSSADVVWSKSLVLLLRVLHKMTLYDYYCSDGNGVVYNAVRCGRSESSQY